jgi:hypothetical protein
VRDPDVYMEHKYKIVKDFDILLKILLAAGLSFAPLNGKKRKTKFLSKFTEVAINVLALFVVLVNIFFWQRRYSSVTLHFSTFLTIFFALAVRFALFLNRGQIPRMIRHLIYLYEDITRKKPYKSLKIPILIGCVTTLFLTMTASILDGYRIHGDRAKGEHSIYFLIPLNDTDGRYQKWMHTMFMLLVPIKMYFAYGVSVVILIFCSSIYTVVKRIVYAFHDQIKQHNRESQILLLTNDMLSAYLNYYNRIIQSVSEIDKVLSPCVLLLYGLMVSGQFYTLTVLISKDTEVTSVTTGLHNFLVFLLTTVAFLVVTLTASKVTEISEDIKISLQKLSEKVTSKDEISSGNSINNTYLILLAILNGTHLSFTGWKMFNINRSFILTTMGVMISYGVIIVQIGRRYNNT